MLRIAPDAGAFLSHDRARERRLFRAADPAVLLRVPLDGLTAIYDRRSGQTHLVADPVPAILDTIGKRTVEAVTLAADLGAAEAVGLIAERLDELATTGLVETV